MCPFGWEVPRHTFSSCGHLPWRSERTWSAMRTSRENMKKPKTALQEWDPQGPGHRMHREAVLSISAPVVACRDRKRTSEKQQNNHRHLATTLINNNNHNNRSGRRTSSLQSHNNRSIVCAPASRVQLPRRRLFFLGAFVLGSFRCLVAGRPVSTGALESGGAAVECGADKVSDNGVRGGDGGQQWLSIGTRQSAGRCARVSRSAQSGRSGNGTEGTEGKRKIVRIAGRGCGAQMFPPGF